MKIKELLNRIIKAIFPNKIKCVCCKKELPSNDYNGFCEKCYKNLPRITDNNKVCLKCDEPINSDANYCLNCKNSSFSFDRNFSVFEYEYPINKIIKDSKYNNSRYLFDILAKFIYEKFTSLNLKVDIIMAVPLHKVRIKQRGYNQSELLCKYFIENNYTVLNNILTRIVDTPNQTHLSKERRIKNMENAFKVIDKKTIKNKTILVIDDVFTTGSTIEHCSMELLKNGAKTVYSITLAHAINNYC